MHRRRSGRARILDARGRLEAQFRIGLQHQRRGEILRREAGVEVPQHDFVDIGRGDAGIGKRLGRGADHQALHRLRIELAKRRVGPSNDTGCHDCFPFFPDFHAPDMLDQHRRPFRAEL